jgi:hypothetical protein
MAASRLLHTKANPNRDALLYVQMRTSTDGSLSSQKTSVFAYLRKVKATKRKHLCLPLWKRITHSTISSIKYSIAIHVAMPPRTRAIFLEHQHNIKGDTEERVFVREWNQKSKNDRAAWVNSFNLLQGYRQTKDQLQQEYEQTDQNIRRLYRERPLRAKAFHKAVNTGLEQAQRLRTATVTLRNQYNAFRALEGAQPGHSPAGLIHVLITVILGSLTSSLQ